MSVLQFPLSITIGEMKREGSNQVEGYNTSMMFNIEKSFPEYISLSDGKTAAEALRNLADHLENM